VRRAGAAEPILVSGGESGSSNRANESAYVRGMAYAAVAASDEEVAEEIQNLWRFMAE